MLIRPLGGGGKGGVTKGNDLARAVTLGPKLAGALPRQVLFLHLLVLSVAMRWCMSRWPRRATRDASIFLISQGLKDGVLYCLDGISGGNVMPKDQPLVIVQGLLGV